MANTASLSFLSTAEKLTLIAYDAPREFSVLASETISRIAAASLLSTAAALDIAAHSLLVLPTFIYVIGRSFYLGEKADFNLPWQHIQRVCNAVAPLFLGSALGILHPFAGIAVSEPSDKHIALGILSSNTNQHFTTPCSPVHSLSMIEQLGASHPYAEHQGVRREIFSREHLELIGTARSFEESLEALQSQEYIHKIANTTLYVMALILTCIKKADLDCFSKELLIRLSGLLVPVLAIVDVTIALIAQAFFLATGLIRIISGSGPIYTEVTTNPLMHLSFFIQNILKALGNLLGTCIWFVDPMTGFQVSLLPAAMFFKIQMCILMLKIEWQIYFAEDRSRFALPIVFGNGECPTLSFPTDTMHKTYLIVEKNGEMFNLYWVNRPNITMKRELTKDVALTQIRSMLDERFPFMDMLKLMDYPVKSSQPEFSNSVNFATIGVQGNSTNCVVSNLFGMLEALDRITGADAETTRLRYKTVRESLMDSYRFYADDFSPFTQDYSIGNVSYRFRDYPEASV